jgi:hypothetical protein
MLSGLSTCIPVPHLEQERTFELPDDEVGNETRINISQRVLLGEVGEEPYEEENKVLMINWRDVYRKQRFIEYILLWLDRTVYCK